MSAFMAIVSARGLSTPRISSVLSDLTIGSSQCRLGLKEIDPRSRPAYKVFEIGPEQSLLKQG